MTNSPDAPKTKRKLGRPRVHPEGGRRPQLAFRVRGDTYEKLKTAAEAADRSISEEVESIIVMHLARNDSSVGPDFNRLMRALEAALILTWQSSPPNANSTRERTLFFKGAADRFFDYILGADDTERGVSKIARLLADQPLEATGRDAASVILSKTLGEQKNTKAHDTRDSE